MDWSGKTWTRVINHEVIKHGGIKHGVTKHVENAFQTKMGFSKTSIFR